MNTSISLASVAASSGILFIPSNRGLERCQTNFLHMERGCSVKNVINTLNSLVEPAFLGNVFHDR